MKQETPSKGHILEAGRGNARGCMIEHQVDGPTASAESSPPAYPVSTCLLSSSGEKSPPSARAELVPHVLYSLSMPSTPLPSEWNTHIRSQYREAGAKCKVPDMTLSPGSASYYLHDCGKMLHLTRPQFLICKMEIMGLAWWWCLELFKETVPVKWQAVCESK